MSITNTIATYLIFLAYINLTKFEGLISIVAVGHALRAFSLWRLVNKRVLRGRIRKDSSLFFFFFSFFFLSGLFFFFFFSFFFFGGGGGGGACGFQTLMLTCTISWLTALRLIVLHTELVEFYNDNLKDTLNSLRPTWYTIPTSS